MDFRQISHGSALALAWWGKGGRHDEVVNDFELLYFEDSRFLGIKTKGKSLTLVNRGGSIRRVYRQPNLKLLGNFHPEYYLKYQGIGSTVF